MPKLKKIDCLFDFENALDEMINIFDPDIKEKAIDKIKVFAIECFKVGLQAGKMPENNIKKVIK